MNTYKSYIHVFIAAATAGGAVSVTFGDDLNPTTLSLPAFGSVPLFRRPH